MHSRWFSAAALSAVALLGGGCADSAKAPAPTAGGAAAPALSPAVLRTVNLTMPLNWPTNCPPLIKAALESLPGVGAEVSQVEDGKGLAIVKLSDKSVTDAQLIKVLLDEGYEAIVKN